MRKISARQKLQKNKRKLAISSYGPLWGVLRLTGLAFPSLQRGAGAKDPQELFSDEQGRRAS